MKIGLEKLRMSEMYEEKDHGVREKQKVLIGNPNKDQNLTPEPLKIATDEK